MLVLEHIVHVHHYFYVDVFSLRFVIDYHSLTSEKTSLMCCASSLRISNSGSSYFNFKETHDSALRCRLVVVVCVVKLSMVLPCARCK